MFPNQKHLQSAADWLSSARSVRVLIVLDKNFGTSFFRWHSRRNQIRWFFLFKSHSAFTQHHAVQKFERLKYSNSFLRILWRLIIFKIHYLWRALLPKSFQTLQQRVVFFRRFGLTCPSSVYLKTEIRNNLAQISHAAHWIQ